MSDKIRERYRVLCMTCSGYGETRTPAGVLCACGRCEGRGWVFALPGWTEDVQGKLQGWPAVKGVH